MKSRTNTRPALQHKSIGFFLWPVAYVFAVLILFQFFSIQVALSFYEKSPTPDTAKLNLILQKESPTTTRITKGFPVRIKIPSIQVDAIIRDVGLTPNGSMDIPKLPLDTAWYKLGPKPGERGSAVIAGHVNWWYGATGVFEHLKNLKPGDIITIQDTQGEETSFVVRTTRAFGQKENASDVFLSYDGKSHLNLITCDGVWDKASKAYSKRLVVFTDKIVD